jgi:hypothetical protein
MPSPLSRSVATNIRKSSRDATFIFFGRVEREGASALSQIAAGPHTNVVRIERILRAPDVLQDFNGQEATYLAESATGARSTGVFFTVPFAFGETVGLREVGSIAEVGDVDAVAELITQVGDEMSDEALRADLREAAVVVHGRVVETSEVPATAAEPLSEHSPKWRIARVEVEAALKGEAKGVISIRYPSSTDVRWYAVPKPTVGEDAIFILHRDGPFLRGAELAILHPMDVVRASPQELERYRRLL